jgi:hypothetical protein
MMQLLVTSITNEESIRILSVPRLGNYQCNPGLRNRSSSHRVMVTLTFMRQGVAHDVRAQFLSTQLNSEAQLDAAVHETIEDSKAHSTSSPAHRRMARAFRAIVPHAERDTADRAALRPGPQASQSISGVISLAQSGTTKVGCSPYLG